MIVSWLLLYFVLLTAAIIIIIRTQLLKKPLKPKYFYDIERTKVEAYSHSWQLLHQVSNDTSTHSRGSSGVSIPQPGSLNCILNMNV